MAGKPSFSSFFLLLFLYKERTREAHAKGERKQQQQDDISVPDLYHLWRKTSRGQGLPCPGVSPAEQTVPGGCGDLSPQPCHRDMQGLHTWTHLLPAQAPTGLQVKAFFFCFFFFAGSIKQSRGRPLGMLKPLPTLCSTLSPFFLKATSLPSHRLLPAYPCALSVCGHAQIAKALGQGPSFCSGHTQSLRGAILLAGYCLPWSRRQKQGLVQMKYKWKDACVCV